MTERKRLIALLKDSSQYLTEQDSLIERIVDYLLENGVIVPPCKIGDEINGEIVCDIDYSETLGLDGNVYQEKMVHTCDKDNIEKFIRTTHPITWEEALKARDNK